MIILDTNIWVALFNENDSCHKEANSLFEKIQNIILIPEYILIETLTILHIKGEKEMADNFIEICMNNVQTEILYSSKEFVNNVITFFQENSFNKLSFIDQSLLFMSFEHDVKTFDKDLEKAINSINISI